MVEFIALSTCQGRLVSGIPVHPGPAGRQELRAFLSLKEAGDMKQTASGPPSSSPRQRLFSRLQISPDRVHACRQVHSRRVLYIDQEEPEAHLAKEADGFITRGCRWILAVTVADCLPLFIVDKKGGAYGLLHSGWQGTGIIRQAISDLGQRCQCRPEDLQVVIGPGIGSCCYQVEESRYRRFRHSFGNQSVRRRGKRYYLDLRQANIRLLEAAGVRDMVVIRDCTRCNPLLGSYRRDGPQAHTHMLALIGPIPAPINPL